MRSRTEFQELQDDAWISSYIEDLLKGQCDPYKPANVNEALTQMDLADQILLSAYAYAANKHPNNNSAHVHLADFIKRVINDYWAHVAEYLAKKAFDERID